MLDGRRDQRTDGRGRLFKTDHLQSVAAEVLPAMGRPMPGRKLGKEVLSDLMAVFAGRLALRRPALRAMPLRFRLTR
jgi:hypothetical protein